MKIGIITNILKDNQYTYTKLLVTMILARGGQVFLHESTQKDLSSVTGVSFVTDFQDVDLIMTLGGDGTFLDGASYAYKNNVPVIGVNLGSLGFMTEIAPDDLETSVDRIFNQDYTIVSRMVLNVEIYNENKEEKYKGFAINDVVFSRDLLSRIPPFALYIDGQLIEVLPGDGLIIASPIGSTGYMMSAGGPIVDPRHRSMLIKPICPHTLHNRTYDLSEERVISVKTEGPGYKTMCTIDGKRIAVYEYTDEVFVRVAERSLHILLLNQRNFFKELPSKLRARGDLYN